MQKKYKFITIAILRDRRYRDKFIYLILENKTKLEMGIIHYNKKRRRYVLSPASIFTVFEHSPLKDIVDFMEQIPKPGTANETNSTQSTS